MKKNLAILLSVAIGVTSMQIPVYGAKGVESADKLNVIDEIAIGR